MQKEKVQSKNLLPNVGAFAGDESHGRIKIRKESQPKNISKFNMEPKNLQVSKARISYSFWCHFQVNHLETVGRLPPHPLPVIVRLQSHRSPSPCRCHIITPNSSLQGSDQGTRLGGSIISRTLSHATDPEIFSRLNGLFFPTKYM